MQIFQMALDPTNPIFLEKIDIAYFWGHIWRVLATFHGQIKPHYEGNFSEKSSVLAERGFPMYVLRN